MAEVDIQRREHTGMPAWIWVIIVLIIIAIIWWAVAAGAGRDTAANPATTPDATTTGATAPSAAAALPLAAIRANPDGHFGQTISGLATVDSVVGAQGFWITKDGTKMFVAHDLAGLPPDQTIQAGDTVSLKATVQNPDTMETAVPGLLNLPEATRSTLQGEPAFLTATGIEVQTGGNAAATPGTTATPGTPGTTTNTTEPATTTP